MGAVVILQRGHRVEKAKSPEHRPFHRRHNRSFASRLRVDAEWDSDGIYQGESGGKSDWPGGSFPEIALG